MPSLAKVCTIKTKFRYRKKPLWEFQKKALFFEVTARRFEEDDSTSVS